MRLKRPSGACPYLSFCARSSGFLDLQDLGLRKGEGGGYTGATAAARARASRGMRLRRSCHRKTSSQ